MNYWLFISLIIAAVSGLFAMTRQLQMLQQNSYFPSRYTAWVKGSYTVQLALEAIGFCVSSLLYARSYIAQFFFLTAVLVVRVISAVYSQKKSIKRLNPTARIKRLYGSAAILFAIFTVIYLLSPKTLTGEIFTVITFMLSFVSPLLTLLCWALNSPIEKSVSNWYVNDAKRILKEHKNLIVIGITGSYGKTTTKFILNRLLSEKYNVVATPQSYNTPMGVVRTIREKLQPQTEILICEMGAKNVGDIKEICDIVNPDYGLITAVGPQHLDTFKSVDNVFKTKFELADEVIKNQGVVFVNGDSAEIISRIDYNKYTVYGTDSTFSCCAENITYGRNGSEFTLNLDNNKITLSSKLLGRHSIINITGAAALAYRLGVPAEDIKYAVASLKATEHRLEMKSFMSGSLLIDDAYNANPEGCLEAVRVLGSFDGMKKVIVTPGLIELGVREYECNYALGIEAAKFCDIIILVGKNRSKPMREAIETTDFNKDNLYIVSSFKEAMNIFAGFAGRDTVVLFENDLPDNYLN